MGYSTDFNGQFTITPNLKQHHAKYLKDFAGTRRMARNNSNPLLADDKVRNDVKLPVGYEGSYFVGSIEGYGQIRDNSILNYNSPPKGQPGLWCQWVPTSDGAHLEWDGVEKFHAYEEWLKYIVEHFLSKWGYVLNGEVSWQGEDPNDKGILVATNNKISILENNNPGVLIFSIEKSIELIDENKTRQSQQLLREVIDELSVYLRVN